MIMIMMMMMIIIINIIIIIIIIMHTPLLSLPPPRLSSVNPDGSPLTYRTPTNSPESDDWHAAKAVEIDRLLVTTTMHTIHLYQQPLDRFGDNTYYNPILTEGKVRWRHI